MSVKHYLAVTVSIFCISGALQAADSPLYITNNTANDSTVRIHNPLNKCSSEVLKEAGITRAGQSNTVSPGNLKLACFTSPTNCVADVYMTTNCSGDIIATMTFSLTDGVKNIAMTPVGASKYRITANGFRVVMDQFG